MDAHPLPAILHIATALPRSPCSRACPTSKTLALLGCAVYATIPAFWLTLHPFTEHWRTRGRNAFRNHSSPLASLHRYRRPRARPGDTSSSINHSFAFDRGRLLVLAGLSLYVLASRNFTHVQLSGLAEVEPDRHPQQLITTRHPLPRSSSHLSRPSLRVARLDRSPSEPFLIFALTLFAILTGAFMLRLEDNELEARFGAPYREYRRAFPPSFPTPCCS